MTQDDILKLHGQAGELPTPEAAQVRATLAVASVLLDVNETLRGVVDAVDAIGGRR